MSDDEKKLDYFYPNPDSNGYGKGFAFHRFSVLNGINFNTILDVGSGPCFLLEWLEKNNIVATYEAVDIRADALLLCECKTYSKIPDSKYDLVCMFGTITYNIGGDAEKNRNIFSSLLYSCFQASRRYIVFSVMKKNTSSINNNSNFVFFSEEDIRSILDRHDYKFYCIDSNTDTDEFIVIVSLV